MRCHSCLIVAALSSCLLSGCGVQPAREAANKGEAGTKADAEPADVGGAPEAKGYDAGVNSEPGVMLGGKHASRSETWTGSADAAGDYAHAPIETAEGSVAAGKPSAPAASAPPASDASVARRRKSEEKAEFDSERLREIDREQRRMQSGILTAGSFDDVEHLDDYREFLSRTLQQDVQEVFPRFALGDRVMIRVTDGNDKPIGGAKVVISPAADQQTDTDPEPLLRVTTGSDGRAMFLSGLDRSDGTKKFRVTVTPVDGGGPLTVTRSIDAAPWSITLPQSQSRLPGNLDLALVIDTTGSMSDELEYLKVEIDSIAATVRSMFPNVDQRFALIVYRDQGDQYVTQQFDFTGSLSDFQENLSKQRANGGGDYPEAMHQALHEATALKWRGGNTARLMFLVGDAPPHDRYAAEALSAVQTLRQQGVRVYPIGASGVATKAEFVMRAAAFTTLGQYLFLTDHSGVGNPHATPHVPKFKVERLDRLMIRMIASELAGRRLEPDHVIAIEKGQMEVRPVQPEENAPDQGEPSGSALLLPTESSFRWLALGLLVFGTLALDTCRRHRAGS